jgi:hypothetical protein
LKKWWRLWKRDSIWFKMKQGRLLVVPVFGFSGSDGFRLEIMIDERSLSIYIWYYPKYIFLRGSIVRYSTYPIKTCEVTRKSMLYDFKTQFPLNTWISIQ